MGYEFELGFIYFITEFSRKGNFADFYVCDMKDTYI